MAIGTRRGLGQTTSASQTLAALGFAARGSRPRRPAGQGRGRVLLPAASTIIDHPLLSSFDREFDEGRAMSMTSCVERASTVHRPPAICVSGPALARSDQHATPAASSWSTATSLVRPRPNVSHHARTARSAPRLGASIHVDSRRVVGELSAS